MDFSSSTDLEEIQGFANAQKQSIEGSGTVAWYVNDAKGRSRELRIPAYYIPTSRVRLLSVGTVLKRYPGEEIIIKPQGLTLSGIEGSKNRGKIFAPFNCHSRLPVSIGHRRSKATSDEPDVHLAQPVVSAENTNLSPAEKELLRWHQRLGHIAFKKVQHLMKGGVLAYSEATRHLQRTASRIQAIKCAACQYAKQRAQSAPGVSHKIIKNREGALSQGQLFPGQEICVDHFICSNKGRLFTSRGASKESDMYVGGAIFVDQASGYIHTEFQTTLTSHATLEAKESFKRH